MLDIFVVKKATEFWTDGVIIIKRVGISLLCVNEKNSLISVPLRGLGRAFIAGCCSLD